MGSVSLINGHIDDDVMTDEEIVKALECCISQEGNCDECPQHSRTCVDDLLRLSLNLINRKNEEIESLEADILADKVMLPMLIEAARDEAFKEFAEAYKDQIEDCTGMFTDEGFYIPRDAVLNAVDFIRERMAGEN